MTGSGHRAEVGYRTIVHWYPHEDGWTPDALDETHPSLAVAEHSGQKWGCLRGVRRVEVYSPDGTLQALWDKESVHVTFTPWDYDDETGEVSWDRSYRRSQWQRLGNESKTLGRQRIA